MIFDTDVLEGGDGDREGKKKKKKAGEGELGEGGGGVRRGSDRGRRPYGPEEGTATWLCSGTKCKCLCSDV